ncbi:SANT domain-containing 2 [Hyphodiscus hymeniophilus]|uniref:SANT domain-containing 2 n=1 Tax=Hyphodiscus hymeniophilus TaxID=353542 RepID=A0A9P7AZ23_9HELO|nr:SANT domain-containing 2 [Hyphodiscus hymeniophilus]
MTKDNSRRSSAAGSTHSPSPRENGLEVPAQETQQSSEANPNMSRSASSNRNQSNLIQPDTPVAPAAESQPMTASNSNSSNPPAVDGVESGLGLAAPYGTRSRNRTGTSRPNYAEDKELDAEFEVAAPSKEGSKGTRGADPVSATNGDGGRSGNNTRKSQISDSDHTAGLHKEPIPGTSTFSAIPATTAPTGQPSKKRKANGAPATNNLQPQIPVSINGTVPTVTRRASVAAQGFRDTNMLSFDDCRNRLDKDKRLIADDGTVLEVNDHVYLVCEPPGEPYYLGRIMEFLHAGDGNDRTQPIDALRLNWYYRPKDIGRKVNDTRQVFASMHSDISPLTALRGKCQIKHKSEVDKLDELRRTPNSFWYEKLYDRYIHRFYDVIPTSNVINVPVEVKKVLDERWRYIVVEPGRGKELTSAVKSCKRCNKYCASNDSVDCAVCQNTYHMSCVNPPLLKKPSRGFAWACGPCSKAQEKKLEARNTPNINEMVIDGEDEEIVDEEDDFGGTLGESLDTSRTSPARSSEEEPSIHPGTAEQIHQASLWLFRYLGIHCRVEDALDYDDRIYPRASSRLGPRHQANVTSWPGRPVEYVKPADIKRKYVKGGGHKKDTKLSKETLAALEADKVAREKRPKWVMDEPPGYTNRGEDYEIGDPRCTSELLFKLPEAGEVSERRNDDKGLAHISMEEREQIVTDYMERAKKLAKVLGLPLLSTNLLDVALDMLRISEYNPERALELLSVADKKLFKEPALSAAELKKFEDGVSKYGSEWHSLKKHVKSMKYADIVRYYYTWKKTERGKQVWGNYFRRKGKKEAKKAESSGGKLQDDVADEHDDSAFDNDKAIEKKRGFQCKFCSTRSSPQWRRAPNTAAGTMIPDNINSKATGKDKGTQLMVALCWRCAYLWRRYAIQYEEIEELAKKIAQGGGRAWKRRIDEELLKELVATNETFGNPTNVPVVGSISAGGTPVPGSSIVPASSEPPRKKIKGANDRDPSDTALDSGGIVTAGQPKKKPVIEKPAPPPPPPEPPKAILLPCAICAQMEPLGDQHLTCRDCRMAVHRNCYGVVGENRSPSKWVCDMCSNDKNPQVSIQYKCMLCPVEHTEQDFMEPPKTTHKKKSEKDRERDRVERDGAQKVADYFRKKQEELNKPLNPREPLKRTANNNWVHVTCAVFTPEVKFGNAKAMEPSEGIPSILSARYDEVCKACKQTGGAFHVECAHQAGYILGFDITPVKGSRRDQTAIVNINSEIGTMSAAVWCKEHVPTKTIVHRMYDVVDDAGLNALQLYVQKFKQADLTLTGTVRKATLVNQSTKVPNPTSVTTSTNRKASTTTTYNTTQTSRGSLSHVKIEESVGEAAVGGITPEYKCVTCNVGVSPKWWPCPSPVPQIPTAAPTGLAIATNGDYHMDVFPHATNLVSQGPTGENGGGGNMALAAAALHQNIRQPMQMPIVTEFQCHKCHWKRIRKESTPPPPAPPVQREPSRSAILAPPMVSAPASDADGPRPMTQYAWPPPPPSYPPSASFGNWARSAPHTVGQVNQLNGGHSSHPNNGTISQINGQLPMRQPMQGPPPSPHETGHMNQTPTRYSHPPSPHRSLGSAPRHMSNGAYTSFATTRPPPQHLTNGGPPPRAPERPFQQPNAVMHPRQPFGPPHGSPPVPRDTYPPRPDSNNPQNNIRPNDGRLNGGASASPSLRNLLS